MVTMIVIAMVTGYYGYNDSYSNGYWLLLTMVTMMVIMVKMVVTVMVTGYYGNNDSCSNVYWLL